MAQLWGGRFTKETNQLVYNFNASISFDKKFYRQDMEGSIAHVKMLGKQGILTEEETKALVTAVKQIYRKWRKVHLRYLISMRIFTALWRQL